MIEVSSRLKSLHVLKTALEKECQELDEKIAKKNQELEKVLSDIQKLTDKDLVASEHAILRYCQRVLGIDIEAIQNAIVTDNLRKQYEVLGDGKYTLDCGLNGIIKNKVVATID